MVGLFDALNKFDINRDLKFDTYASFRVRGAIIDGLRKEDWLPRSAREKAKKLDAQIEQLEQKYMRHVTPEELAEHMEVSVEDVYQTVQEHFFQMFFLLMNNKIKKKQMASHLSYATIQQKHLSKQSLNQSY